MPTGHDAADDYFKDHAVWWPTEMPADLYTNKTLYGWVCEHCDSVTRFGNDMCQSDDCTGALRRSSDWNAGNVVVNKYLLPIGTWPIAKKDDKFSTAEIVARARTNSVTMVHGWEWYRVCRILNWPVRPKPRQQYGHSPLAPTATRFDLPWWDAVFMKQYLWAEKRHEQMIWWRELRHRVDDAVHLLPVFFGVIFTLYLLFRLWTTGLSGIVKKSQLAAIVPLLFQFVSADAQSKFPRVLTA